MFGSEKEKDESSKQVTRLDQSYFDMPYKARVKYIRIVLNTMSPSPEVRAKYIAKLNALEDEAKDQN